MRTAGIVAEYNPFHRGHAWQIRETRARLGGACAVVCVMSGNWVQSADCAIADKWTRAALALEGGADLVLELPTLWAVASAECFARGAVGLLDAAGVVDVLSFGSEAGELAVLQKTAETLELPEYEERLRQKLTDGRSYAAARQAAVQELIGSPADCLSGPNNNLGVEYLRALHRLASPIRGMTVARQGAGYHQLGASDGFASATEIRRLLRAGRDAEQWLWPGAAQRLAQTQQGDLRHCQRAILARLRTMSPADWAALPDSGAAEGLPERLTRAARQAVSLEEFYDKAKTKRYTHARLRRLVLWGFLGLTEGQRPERPPYLRVLGMTRTGQSLLRDMKQKAKLPVLTKAAHIRELPEPARRVFELENRCTDLYALCLEQPWPCGREYTAGPVILGERNSKVDQP